MNGIVVINKQQGETSFKTVSFVRKIFNEKKAGHCGTLDPLATGVLPVMIGNAVKCTEYLTDHDKKYTAKIKFGYTSNTEDITGELKRSDNYFIPDINRIKTVLFHFIGKIKQKPPMYSAIKINGNKLYDLARKGVEIERPFREVTVYSIEVFENDGFYLDVICSKGTYIRTLCADIGKMLGCGAVMESLCRTAVGKCVTDTGVQRFEPFFEINGSFTNKELETMDESQLANILIPVEKIYLNLKPVFLNEFYERLFRNGVEIYAEKSGIGALVSGELYRIYGKDGFFAVGIAKEYENGMAIKVKNFF